MCKHTLFIASIIFLYSSLSFSQISESEVLSEGILFARFPDSVKPANPEIGLCIYNTDFKCLECYDGNQWQSMCSSSVPASGFYINSPNNCGQLDENGIKIIDAIYTTCSSINIVCDALANIVAYDVKVGSQPLASNYNLISTSDDQFLINNYPLDETVFWITIDFLDAANTLIGQTICAFTAKGPVVGGTDYADILANAPDWMCLETANEYLAEFLRQNPDVSYWSQNHAAQSIMADDEPVISGTRIDITPTGADDNQLIEDAISQAGQGGVVDGGGATFLINDPRIDEAGVTLRNMTLKPSVNTAYRGLLVAAPDVTFLRVHLDLENKQYRMGIEVNDNSDRFAFVESSIKNFYNNSGFSGNMLRLYEAADDVYIVNSEFVHGIGGAASGNSSVRGIRVASTDTGVTPKGGIIASNLFEDLQAAGQGDDADGMVFQGFDLDNQYQMGFRVAVLANVGINSGKRLIKAQSGGVDVHSNVNHWKDLNGELGERVTRCHYDSHGVSNLRWTNNLAITDHSNAGSESFFMQIQTHTFSSDIEADNIVLQCNKYIHNDDTSGGRSSYVFVIMDFNDSTNGYAWPTMSFIKDNVIEGAGLMRFIWWFKFGNDPMGTQFDHLQNTINIANEDGLYRPN